MRTLSPEVKKGSAYIAGAVGMRVTGLHDGGTCTKMDLGCYIYFNFNFTNQMRAFVVGCAGGAGGAGGGPGGALHLDGTIGAPSVTLNMPTCV